MKSDRIDRGESEQGDARLRRFLDRVRWRLLAGRNVEDVDASSNVEWNRRRWGQSKGWSGQDGYGYQWGKGHQQRTTDVSRFADSFLRPHLGDRYDLKILELAPGAGRFTAELIRYAREMVLVDLNRAAIDLCKERLRFFPTPVTTYVNDGQSLQMIEDDDFDLFACFDSMVHMHPEVIRNYVEQAARLMVPGGILWLDHSGHGAREVGHRTDVTLEWMTKLATELGLEVVGQRMRNDWDCVSVLRVPQ